MNKQQVIDEWQRTGVCPDWLILGIGDDYDKCVVRNDRYFTGDWGETVDTADFADLWQYYTPEMQDKYKTLSAARAAEMDLNDRIMYEIEHEGN